jgi:exosortase D (VPLPA-CTERM-specific)
MQLLSTTLGFYILDGLGVPVFQEGNIVDLGGIKLQVVEACSGLRYLFPLMSFGYLAACLLDDRLWKKIVLFLSSVPITIGMNSLRIALIGVTVDLWGGDMAVGLLHDFEGWSIFLACAALLLGEMALLVRIGHRGNVKLSYIGLADGAPFLRMPSASRWSIAGFAISLVFAVLMTSGGVSQRQEIIPAHRLLSLFPDSLGAWRGRQGAFTPDVVTALGMDDYWLGLFNSPQEAAPVEFYTAYYASQRIGSVAHSPSNCIPGSGWVIEDSSLRTVDLGGDEKALSVRRVLISKSGIRQLVYYWFDEAGREVASELAVKLSLLRSSIVDRRSDGALIRLVTPVGAGEKVEDAEGRLISFVRLVHPVIRAYLPGEEVAEASAR